MGGATSKRQEKYLCLQLHNAIIGGDETVAKELLCGAVSPNNKLFMHSRKLFLPLFTAVENNCTPLVEILLQYNASTSAVNKEGNTPLHIAADQNLLEVAEILLRHQADPCAVNSLGQAPLHIAATHGLVNMVSLLISSGASVNSSGPLKRTPLHSACAITGNNDMITTLLNNGVELDATDDEHRVPLHYLAQLGNTQGIDILLQAGADKNACDAKGKSALHFTVENQEIQATRALLRHGCDVNVQDCKGQTPLHKAVEKEYSELVSILVHNEADPNLATNSGYFPLRISIWKKNFDITQKLILYGGANVNASDRNGITALHVACLYALKESEDDMELVELLIGSGSDVNTRCSKHGRSPLHNAVEARNDETVMMLLRSGADSNAADNKGKTPRSICTEASITALLDNVVSYPSHANSTLNSSTDRTPVLSRDGNASLTLPTGGHRPVNVYTPPTSRSNSTHNHSPNDSGTLPPPLPPRDVAFPQQQANLMPELQLPPVVLPPANVIRHNFVWSSLETDCKSASEDAERKIKVDVSSSSKLTSFPTSFGGDKTEPSMFCHSVTGNGQLINTKLGCILNIEPGSVSSTLLLYVQALNYSSDVLPLPKSHRLCSNIIHFYTHCAGGGITGSRDILPDKEVPHLLKPALVEFPLRKSALSMHEKHENEFKILVSFDEGSSWKETSCEVEKIRMEDDVADVAHLAVAEVEELGMYAVVLCPKQDSRPNVRHGDKVTSSVDSGVSLTLNIDHDASCTVHIAAERIQPTELEKLHNQGFAYVLSCSRVLSLQVKSAKESEQFISVSMNLPISISHSSGHSDVSYRILRKSETPLLKGWQCFSKGVWEDITEKECQHLQVSTKGKRLLGSTSNSPPHISFDLLLDPLLKHTFLVTAVRSFTRSLTKHLVQVPDQIERIKTTSSLCFLIHYKVTRVSDVTCDLVSAKDAKNVDKVYRDSGSYLGPSPSAPQIVHERDFIKISTAGGIKLRNNCGIKTRNISFHSALLPFSERFTIKGTSHGQNTTSDYIGSFDFALAGNTDEKSDDSTLSTGVPRSALNSESSVLVVENQAFCSDPPSQLNPLQISDRNSLATLPLQIPKKHHLKISKPTPSSDAASSQLSKPVMELVSRRLDRVELRELAFQLNIPKQRMDDAFTENQDDVKATCFTLLSQWNDEMTLVNRNAIYPLCSGLSCIGRENLSQDVARKCDPFVLEELSGLAPLPETMLLNDRGPGLQNAAASEMPTSLFSG